MLGYSGTSYTATLVFGGGGPYTANTEDWNGTNWTEVNDLNTPRGNMGCSNSGSPTAALAFGGYKPGAPDSARVADTEQWAGITVKTFTDS